jgi:hypothetical protein
MLALAPVQERRQTLYEQIVKKPDINNGYEDYIRAADMLKDGLFSHYARWSPKSLQQFEDSVRARTEASDLEREFFGEVDPAQERAAYELLKRLDKMTLLQVRQEMVERYGKALAQVAVGNRKNVYDPRGAIDPMTLFPELPNFRDLARLATASAHVKAAAGNWRGATTDLLEVLAMADKAGQNSFIAMLVGSANQAIVLAEFEWLMPRLPEPELRRLDQAASSLLSNRNPLIGPVQGEYQYAISAIRMLCSSPAELVEQVIGSGEEVHEKTRKFMSSLQPTQLRAMESRLLRKVEDWKTETLTLLQGEERNWYTRTSIEEPSGGGFEFDEDEELVVESLSALQDVLSDYILPSPIATFSTNIGIRRTQLRLLALHARVQLFRLHHRRLPHSLDEVVTPAGAYDPFAHANFVYTPKEREEYRIHSLGVPSTGIVEMRYRRDNSIINAPRLGDEPPLRAQR